MSKRKKSIKPIIIVVMILLIIAAVVFCYNVKLHIVISEKGQSSEDYKYSVEFKGSERYTDEELSKMFFKEESSKNAFLFWYRNTFDEKIEIPFVETYDLEMTSFGKFTVTLYDKSVVGYLTYMGNNIYFDKDGMAVESSETELENVPQVTGLTFDYFVLHEELPVKDKKIFPLLLDLTQLCKKYDLQTDHINITANEQIELYLGTIVVNLGDGSQLTEKMLDLNDLYGQIKDETGVLHMEEYDYENNGYILKKN